jgi:hypothetical protein
VGEDVFLNGIAPIDVGAEVGIHLAPWSIDLGCKPAFERRQVFVKVLAILIAGFHAKLPWCVAPVLVGPDPVAEMPAVARACRRVAVAPARPLDDQFVHVFAHLSLSSKVGSGDHRVARFHRLGHAARLQRVDCPDHDHHPLTHSTCFKVCTTSTRSRWFSITSSMSL